MDHELEKHDIGGLLKIINDKLRKNADAALSKYNLSFSQVRVMKFLNRHGGVAAQKEIERYLKISHPTTVGLVSRLEKGGFVDTYTDRQDRRNKMVCTTSKSDELSRFMHQHVLETESALTDGFTPEDINALRNMLYKLYENIENSADFDQ